MVTVAKPRPVAEAAGPDGGPSREGVARPSLPRRPTKGHPVAARALETPPGRNTPLGAQVNTAVAARPQLRHQPCGARAPQGPQTAQAVDRLAARIKGHRQAAPGPRRPEVPPARAEPPRP